MNSLSGAELRPGAGRSARFHRLRQLKDTIAGRLIAAGGIAVIVAVVLILFYLVYVVYPLFLPASASQQDLGIRQDWSGARVLYAAVEEQREIALRIDQSGVAEFFRLKDLSSIASQELFPPETLIVASAEADQGNGLVALATSEGGVVLLRHSYQTNYDNGVAERVIIPAITFPYGAEVRPVAAGLAVTSMALSDGDKALVVATTSEAGIQVDWNEKQENFLSGEVELQNARRQVAIDFPATGLAISGNQRWLYVADALGRVHRYSLPGLEAQDVVSVSEVGLTALKPLLGGISILAGDARGEISQLFPVRDEDNQYHLRLVRTFTGLSSEVVQIVPEYRRKGFLALGADGHLGIYHSTAGQIVLDQVLEGGTGQTIALTPRANGLVQLSVDGQVRYLDINNQHPEVSIASLWRKVWYENYPEPQYIWQSSAATNEFEPKFSLTPLAFGTLKAALFAMFFAVPIALMGAAYAAYFMAPALREFVKPTIEIMAALPTVILGFLAGLWFAPFLEENLASLLTLALLLPLGLLLFAYWWSHYRGRAKGWVKEGWEPALLLPVIAGLVALSLNLADPLQQWIFGGDLRNWLSQVMGISYDQRNALVVGFAMGFAVIPTIFSMAEDAVFGVPKTLSDGSLALGATPWQTMVRVILPTASPGIFSALMIGLGRAVGETMIVLMATGNTPVMDWSMFEGMRTLAANIAVEMPESEVDSSHYRILFLAALVLFMFTFVVNTGAELIRQRLRERYSSL